MKILIISAWGESAYIWLKLVTEGNEVKVWIKDPAYRKEIYEGLVDKVEAWQPYVNWCDFVLFDQTGMSDIYESIIKRKPCFGGHPLGDLLEKDREMGHKIMDLIGLKHLESITFNSVKDAQNHIRTHKVPHVIKPFGPKVSSEDIIISEDANGEDAIALLHRFEKRNVPFKGIEVEERKTGVEVGISAWFNGHDFVPPININFEHKRFATGVPEGMGFLTGEMGTAMRYDGMDNRIFRSTLARMESILRDTDYRGQWDISFIADKDGYWPLEHTPRLGYPALAIEMAVQKTPLTELFHGIATGKIKENVVSYDWAVGVVVVDYGFPFNDEVKKRSTEYPIFNLDEDNIHHVNLYEAKAGIHDDGVPGLVTSEGMGYPMVITGTGKTLPEAQKDCYRFLDLKNPDRIRVPNSWWRTDIGNRVLEQKDQILKWGLLNSFE